MDAPFSPPHIPGQTVMRAGQEPLGPSCFWLARGSYWLLTRCCVSSKTQAKRGLQLWVRSHRGVRVPCCVCARSQRRGRAIRGHFPFPHPLREAPLQGRFACRFNDQSSSCAQNRDYFLFFLSLLLNTWPGRGQLPFRLRFSLGASAACSFQPGLVSVHLSW